HTEDILSVASSPPNHLATSSYDGSIIVWNTVSGHVYCKIPPPPPPSDYEDECLDGDLSVTRVLFLRTRAGNREAASLLASGPRGRIHLWNIYQGGKLYSQFQNHPGHGHMVSAMSVDVNDTILVTGDRFGHVSIWSIYEYALHGPESLCPELLFRWRAHTETVSQVDVVTLMQKRVFVVTASEDFTVRIWTRRGEYVGTFGQSTEWSLYNEDSFGPLKVPIDVLVDPKSMPEPLAIKELDKEKTTLDENGASGGSVTGQPQQQQQQQPQRGWHETSVHVAPLDTPPMWQELPWESCPQRWVGGGWRFLQRKSVCGGALRTGTRVPTLSGHPPQAANWIPPSTARPRRKQQKLLDDTEISAMVREKSYVDGKGKRLRNERLTPKLVDRGGPSDFQTLRLFALTEVPKGPGEEGKKSLKKGQSLLNVRGG
uniref:WD_REPEATS_REGION domain-containing protein n=1 Tax=Macrostomum lignano TaxID=282301 RepID=A0A1I8HT69_9PLAT